MPRARQKAAGSIPAAAAAGQAAASRSSVDATTYDWARSAAISKESRLGPQLSYEAKLMQGFVRAGRQGNLPLERLSVNDARLLSQADLSPADMHFVHKGIMSSGLESPDFESQLTGDEARVFGRIKSGGSSIYDLDVGPGSLFDRFIAQSEGVEGESGEPGKIWVAWEDAADDAGNPYKRKLYEAYNDQFGNPTAGHGVLVTKDLMRLNKNKTPGAENDRSKAVFYAEDIDRVQQERVENARKDVKQAFPLADFLGDARQAVLMDMGYTMGLAKLLEFKKLKEYAADGDFWSAGLEIIRAKRSNQTGARSLLNALIFCTNGDPSLTGDKVLEDFKRDLTAAYEEQKRTDKSKTYVEVMEEMYRQKARELGYGPKTE